MKKKQATKFFRKALLRVPAKKSNYLSLSKTVSKFNRRFRNRKLSTISRFVGSKRGGLAKVLITLEKTVKRYGNYSKTNLLTARRTLSPNKPKLKFKNVIKVRGRPWWFNRERKIHLKFFSWKKNLIGRKSSGAPQTFLEQKPSSLFFFNWVIKKQQQNQNFSKALFFKRLVFAYRKILQSKLKPGSGWDLLLDESDCLGGESNDDNLWG